MVYFIVAASATIFLCIAIFRYQKICRPFGRQPTIIWYRICLLIAFGIGFGYSLPQSLYSLHEIKRDPSANVSATTQTICDWNFNDVRFRAVDGVGIVFIIVISILTISFYIPVIYRTRHLFHKSKANVEDTNTRTLPPEIRNEQNLNVQRRREENTLKRLNKLCFAMALVNSISYVPYCIIKSLALSKTFSNLTMDEIITLTFFTSIPLFQHAVNPYINIAFDLKVRKVIRKLCIVTRCCKYNESNDQTDQPTKTQDNNHEL